MPVKKGGKIQALPISLRPAKLVPVNTKEANKIILGSPRKLKDL